ncbi:hypothetical protein EMIT0158MI4_170093 [Burkholderia ambifaria]
MPGELLGAATRMPDCDVSRHHRVIRVRPGCLGARPFAAFAYNGRALARAFRFFIQQV